jgi:hypothetical protein
MPVPWVRWISAGPWSQGGSHAVPPNPARSHNRGLYGCRHCGTGGRGLHASASSHGPDNLRGCRERSTVPDARTHRARHTPTSRADLCRARPHPCFPLHNCDFHNRLSQAVGIFVLPSFGLRYLPVPPTLTNKGRRLEPALFCRGYLQQYGNTTESSLARRSRLAEAVRFESISGTNSLGQ